MTHIRQNHLWLLAITLLLSVFGARAQSSGSEGATWTVNPHDYKYDMTLYTSIELDGEPVTDYSQYQVGAFVGNECRGTAEVQTKGEAQWLYLRVRSNQPQGETIILRLRNTDSGEEFNLQSEAGDITFESQGISGRPGSPLVLTAAKYYNLVYKLDGEDYYNEEVAYGTTLTPISSPGREGHTFSGWSEMPATMPAHDVEVTGHFTINQYTITFNPNGGSEVAPITQDYNTPVTTPPEPTREGYTFMGWDAEVPAAMPANDLTLTAQWKINSYMLNYIVDGMTYNAVLITYGEAITPEPMPTKEGHTFSGWSEIPATMPAHDVEVTGEFTINTYKLVYKVDGKEYKVDSITYGEAITPEPAPTKEGHTFSGWSGIPATMPAHNVEVKGEFTINTYKLVYKVDGKEYKADSITYATTITPEPVPTKEGHTFSGWSEIPATMPAHDVEVTGEFTINTYKLVYKVDGEVYKEFEVTYGTTITPEAEPEKEGYKFMGWSEMPATMPAHDVEVTGEFTKVTAIMQALGSTGHADVYSLSGRLIKRQATQADIKALPAGPYIIDGRKVVISH